jgi:hypothetical protein
MPTVRLRKFIFKERARLGALKHLMRAFQLAPAKMPSEEDGLPPWEQVVQRQPRHATWFRRRDQQISRQTSLPGLCGLSVNEARAPRRPAQLDSSLVLAVVPMHLLTDC